MDILKEGVKSLNLYEVKAYVRKAQNVVMNYTPMEAKVREATNNEPWGASSSLMQKIASGTYNYREREEICGMIFRRFTEKAANEWRQIYKALQLLEYLIKNGCERIVDDVRTNISLITILKSFHYIDSSGKDQGINVRNRAKNLVNLLNDDSLIRSERKKARENAKKFGAISSSFHYANPNAHNYRSDDDFQANRVYGDGGVFGERYEEQRAAGEGHFEEYDIGESSNSTNPTFQTSNVNVNGANASAQSKQPKAQAEPDLFSFDDASAKAQTKVPEEDDDFDDFQSAVPQQSQHQKQPSLSANLAGLYNQTSTIAPQHQRQVSTDFGNFASFTAVQPTATFQQQPTLSYGISQPIQGSAPQYNYSTPSDNNLTSSASTSTAAKGKNDAFSSLFSTAKSKVHSQPVSRAPSATISNSNGANSNFNNNTSYSTQKISNDDDLFGELTGSTHVANNTNNTSNNSNSGEIDLLSF